MDLRGLRLRYLIGADDAGDGEPGALTVCGYDTTRKPTQGVAGKYINLFDEKNTGQYDPYLHSSDTARQYQEGQCDPAGDGFWRNIAEQLARAKEQGFAVIGDIDNRDAYANAAVLKVYDQAQAEGLSVICKNPGMSDAGEDSTPLLAHPAVAGAIIERGDVTPAQIDAMRKAVGKPELPVWFVAFGDGRAWAEQTAAATKAAHFREMSVTYSAVGEYGSAEDVFVPVTDTASTSAQPLTLGQKIKAVMLARGYPWFPDQNVVSIEGMDPDGTPNANRHNAFDDIKLVLDGDGAIIGGPWAGTTHPGTYWTQHPMADGGAFIIALGPQSCWTPGDYHGLTVWRQAEDSTIMGHRDPNCTYKRQGPPIKHGNIGVHHHGGYNLPKDNISNAAAGCQVIEMTANQAAFMHLTMQCPRYLADKQGYRLTATVIEAVDVLAAMHGESSSAALVPPAPMSPAPVIASSNADFTHCLAMVLVHEGGNDDDPRDPGGRTSRGILQSEWDAWRKSHPGLPSDVWQAPQTAVEAIYKAEYWDLMLCDGLPSGIDYAVFDYGVNSGPSRAAKCLQGILGITADGHIGRNTIAAAASVDAKSVISQLCDNRLAFLRGLSTWGTFGRGWAARVAEVRRDALAMLRSTTTTSAPPAPQPPPPKIEPMPLPMPTSQEPSTVTDPTSTNQGGTLTVPAAPAIHLSDDQVAQILAGMQKLAQSQPAASLFSGLVRKITDQIPALAVLAVAAINIAQAFAQTGASLSTVTNSAPSLLGAGGLIAFFSQVKSALADAAARKQ